jgi:hypothetical protein
MTNTDTVTVNVITRLTTDKYADWENRIEGGSLALRDLVETIIDLVVDTVDGAYADTLKENDRMIKYYEQLVSGLTKTSEPLR